MKADATLDALWLHYAAVPPPASRALLDGDVER
jgi:hypothetical protein